MNGKYQGRRNTGEEDRDCAIREFTEETNITPDKYKLINNIVPLTEEYKGINNVNYKHVYYIGKINQYEKNYILIQIIQINIKKLKITLDES